MVLNVHRLKLIRDGEKGGGGGMEVGEEGDYIPIATLYHQIIVQELCESRGGRPGLSVLTSLLVSVDVELY